MKLSLTIHMPYRDRDLSLSLLHSERPKLHIVLVFLSAIGLTICAILETGWGGVAVLMLLFLEW